MGKNRLALHSVAVLTLVFFAFLAIGSTPSNDKLKKDNATVSTSSSEQTVVSSTTNTKGLFYHIPDPDKKPYDALGLVFATSVTKYDEKGLEVSSQEGIATMLLREAQKLGGNDILNLRIDENVTYVQTKVENTASSSSSSSSSSTSKTTVITTKTVTYTGSALAIKYRN